MKQSKLTIVILGLIILSACKKEPVEKPVQVPPPGQSTNVYRFVVDNLNNVTTPQEGLYALASITNEQNGEAVVTDKKLPLSFNGKYTSENLQLPAGTYKLIKFIVFNKENKVQYAAPLSGSFHETGVSKPLASSFKVPNRSELNVGV